MTVRDPNLDEEIIAYDKLQTDEINKVGNGISIPMTVLQVTGEVYLIIHGNMIYLQGQYTNKTSGQRICIIPTQYAPKASFQLLTNLGEIQVETNGNVTHWGSAGSRVFALSWSTANK